MLIIDLDTFSLDKKDVINNEKGELQYWSQADFAYKKRVHIYDSNDNELGYVQYKILTSQDGPTFFNKEDKAIDVSDLRIINKVNNWQYEIENVASIKVDGNKVVIDIKDDSEIDRCLLLIYSIAGEENNQ